MNGAFAWLRLQYHITVSLQLTRRMDFRNLDKMSSLYPGKRRLQAKDAVRWCGLWLAALARLGWKPACLRRSMVFARVLRLEGYDAHVVLGAKKDAGGMLGHSWVEFEGERVGLPGEDYVAVWDSKTRGYKAEEGLGYDG